MRSRHRRPLVLQRRRRSLTASRAVAPSPGRAGRAPPSDFGARAGDGDVRVAQ